MSLIFKLSQGAKLSRGSMNNFVVESRDGEIVLDQSTKNKMAR